VTFVVQLPIVIIIIGSARIDKCDYLFANCLVLAEENLKGGGQLKGSILCFRLRPFVGELFGFFDQTFAIRFRRRGTVRIECAAQTRDDLLELDISPQTKLFQLVFWSIIAHGRPEQATTVQRSKSVQRAHLSWHFGSGEVEDVIF